MNGERTMVEMSDVHLTLGAREILRGVDLKVAAKERLVILGQSGSGKSTLLRLILGILTPDAGSVKVRGRDIARMSRGKLDLLRSRMGMVYQYSALISSLTVRENLALPLEELTRKSAAEIDRIVDENLDRVGLLDTKDQLPSELSGGMRKRVGLARALVMEPELILLDEPSAGLDPVVSSIIDELIIDLTTESGVTSIIVTHEMDSAFRIATRMAMLYRGEIIADGSPDEFSASENPVVAQFVSGSTRGPISGEPQHANT